MSDISDVLIVLRDTAASVLYPEGPDEPSITNSDIIIYPGWPGSDNLATDIAAGKTHVSIFPKAEERNTTRYSKKFHVITKPAPTLTVVIGYYGAGALSLEGGAGSLLLEGGDGDLIQEVSASATLGGSVSIPQNVMLRVSGKSYVYSVQAGDTLGSIAASLAALVAVDVSGTTSNGAAVIIGPGGRLQAARVGGFGTVARETRRQERVVMITVWAGTPELRDQIAAAIDAVLADTTFLTMPDGFGARLIYKNSLEVDALQKATLYRRDLNYTVEYATTSAKQAAAVIAPILTLKTGPLAGKLELEDGGDLLLEDETPLELESGTSETTITI